jgi:GTP-binding protein YchF
MPGKPSTAVDEGGRVVYDEGPLATSLGIRARIALEVDRLMQIGIVGLASCGKTTLFQTITRTHLDKAAAQRKQANIAVVKVPDARVDALAEVFHPKRRVFPTIEFVDVVGLGKGDHGSSQFTTTFLANVRATDALIHVVRAFDDPACPHPEETIDPARDVRTLETEFILSDLAILEGRRDRLAKESRRVADSAAKVEMSAIEKCLASLEQERPLRLLTLEPAEERMIRGFELLSAKPLLVVVNLPEEQIGEQEQILAALREQFRDTGIAFDAFSGRVEMELAQMTDDEGAALGEEYGIHESALTRIIAAAYKMLGLISFLTVGEDECRAWTITRGSTAQEAAGAIHTDLMQRFIRAETVSFDDFVTYGSIAACKERGVWRLQGKDYIVQDGDIISVRHG